MALTILVSWWRIPENGLFDRLSPRAFDIQGIVPVAYSVFAMALGIAAGVLARRVLPAVAMALGGFIALRVLVGLFLRQHFIAAVTSTFPIDVSGVTRIAHAWWLASYITSPSGGSSETGVAAPLACRTLIGSKQFSAMHCRPRLPPDPDLPTRRPLLDLPSHRSRHLCACGRRPACGTVPASHDHRRMKSDC